MLMPKWSVDVVSGDPFEGTTMYFYADEAGLLTLFPATRVDGVEFFISHTLEVTANGSKFNFGIKQDEGFFHNLKKEGP